MAWAGLKELANMIGREGLIGPWQKGCTMRRAKPSFGPKVQGYRNFAGIILVMAGMIALAGNDLVPAPDAGSAANRAGQDPQSPAQASPAKSLAVRTQAFAMDDTAPDLEVPDVGQDSAAADPSSSALAKRPEPALPGQGGKAENGTAKPAETAPRPGQIERMIAGSRARSGGVDQGDEPVRVT